MGNTIDTAMLKDIRPRAPLPLLVQRKINTAAYGGCGERDLPDVLGCAHWKRCPLRAHFAEKFGDEHGPRNGGIRVVARANTGGSMREFVGTCYDYIEKKEGHEAGQQGGIVEWVADEGETIVVAKSFPMPEGAITPTAYETRVVELTVPAHPHIEGDLHMVNAAMESALRKAHEDRARKEKRDAVMGGPTEGETGERKIAAPPKRR